MYYYKAINKETGKIEKNTLNKETFEELKKYLNEKNLLLIEYKEIKDKKKFKKLKDKDLINICNNFYFVFKSNTNIIQGLSVLKNSDKKNKNLWDHVSKEIEKGHSFPEILEQTGSFPDLFINMLKNADLTGDYDSVFKQLEDYYSTKVELKDKILSATFQPLFLLLSAFVVLFIFLNNILPDIISSLSIEKNKLPFITRMFVSINDFIKNEPKNLFIIVFSLFCFIIFFMKNKKIKKHIDFLILKLPLLGKIFSYYETYKLSILLYMTLKNGLSLLNTIDFINKNINNYYAKNPIYKIKTNLIEGNKISNAFVENIFYPYNFVNSLTIAEDTGKLEEMLLELSNYYKIEFKNNLNKFISLIEPVFTFSIGIFVAIIIIAIALPIFDMVNYI